MQHQQSQKTLPTKNSQILFPSLKNYFDQPAYSLDSKEMIFRQMQVNQRLFKMQEREHLSQLKAVQKQSVLSMYESDSGMLNSA